MATQMLSSVPIIVLPPEIIVDWPEKSFSEEAKVIFPPEPEA